MKQNNKQIDGQHRQRYLMINGNHSIRLNNWFWLTIANLDQFKLRKES